MTALLFDTEDMRQAATQMTRTAGDLLRQAPELAPTGVLMPPALEAEALATAASLGGELAGSSAFYGSAGADLWIRALAVEAENAGGGVALELAGLAGRLAPSSLEVTLPALSERAWGALAASLEGPAAGAAEQAIAAVWEGPMKTAWDVGTGAVDSMITTAEGLGEWKLEFASYAEQASSLEHWGVWKAVDRVNKALAVVDSVQEGADAYQRSSGENMAGRVFNTVAEGAGTLGIDMWAPAGVVDFATDGVLSTDVHFASDMGGAALSGEVQGAERAAEADQTDIANNNELGFIAHMAGGGAAGAWHSADAVWQRDAAYEAAHVSFSVKGLAWLVNTAVDKSYGPASTAVGWAVDHSYGPISNVAGAITHGAQGAGRGVEHVWQRLASAV